MYTTTQKDLTTINTTLFGRQSIQANFAARDENKMENEKKAIIVMDDDKSILRIFKSILNKNGYDVDTAETANEAIKKIKAKSYHAALMDIRLPDMDGIDLLPQLKAISPRMVKILITGFPSVENGVKAIDRGADAYLVKPVKPEELLKIMKEKIEHTNYEAFGPRRKKHL